MPSKPYCSLLKNFYSTFQKHKQLKQLNKFWKMWLTLRLCQSCRQGFMIRNKNFSVCWNYPALMWETLSTCLEKPGKKCKWLWLFWADSLKTLSCSNQNSRAPSTFSHLSRGWSSKWETKNFINCSKDSLYTAWRDSLKSFRLSTKVFFHNLQFHAPIAWEKGHRSQSEWSHPEPWLYFWEKWTNINWNSLKRIWFSWRKWTFLNLLWASLCTQKWPTLYWRRWLKCLRTVRLGHAW